MSGTVNVCNGQPQETKGPCDLTLTNERKTFTVSSPTCNKNERLIICIQIFLYSLKKLFLSLFINIFSLLIIIFFSIIKILSLNKILLH